MCFCSIINNKNIYITALKKCHSTKIYVLYGCSNVQGVYNAHRYIKR